MRAQLRRHGRVERASGTKSEEAGRAAGHGRQCGAVPRRQLFHCGPVYNGNDYLGSDPDPFIRLMIQRDLGARYGGGP